ncbi:MAG: IPT/TIG domain-containing protein, partial [Bryobacteraceae bacterium]
MSGLRNVPLLGAALLLVGWSAVQAAQTPGVLAKAGRLTQPTATGEQAVTGLGFQPKVVLFWMTGNTSDGSAANVQLSVGAATSSTNQWCFAGSAQDGSSTGLAPVRHNSTTAVAGAVAVGSASVLAEAQLTSLDPDGFTLTWTAADSVPRQVTYLALGGISLTNAYAGSYNLPTATGLMAVTGVGFQPTALLVLANPGSQTALPYVESGSLNYESGFYVPVSVLSGDDASVLFQNDALGSASSYEAASVVTTAISTTGVISQARVQTFGSNGFTLNFSAVSGLATPEFYVAVQGPLLLSGSFNQAASFGNQAVSMGFQPAAVLFSSTDRASSSAVVPGAKLSLGVATSSTNRFAMFVGANSGIPTAASQSIDSTEALDMMTPAGASPTTQAAFDFVSNNAAGGFTINNTAVDGTSRQVIYMAIGQPVAAAPSFSPSGGIYSTAQTVSLSTTTSGASIRYTTDGSTPSDTAGTLYTAPIKVSATTIIKAVAYASGFANSPVSTTTYTIGSGPAAAPTFSPPAGTYAGTQSVAISTTTIPASIRYTTNGSTPSNTAGTLYTGPITVGSNTTIKAIAYATGISNSPVSTAAYTIVPVASISSLSPTSGLVGTAVTIAGSNFGASQGSSAVTFNGTSAGAASSWSATSITVAVPSGATSGNVVVTVYGAASNGVPFTVIYPPSISSLSPTSGLVGTFVTIAGGNFGWSQGSSTVTFKGTSAGAASSWSATSITVAVPSGATSGNVVVTVYGTVSNGVPFTVIYPPSISGLSPASGQVGTSVAIAGSNFGWSQGSSTVTFNGTSVGSALSWSNGSITVAVPSGATTGNVVVTVGGLASNGMPFTVIYPPSISSLSPTSGWAGTAVAISGSGFGASQGGSTVTFNGTSAGSASSWSDGSITVTVPSGATTGNVVVTANGLASNGVPFTVITQPSILSLSPTSGPVGAAVVITGSGFAATQGSSTVAFNGTSTGAVSSWSD